MRSIFAALVFATARLRKLLETLEGFLDRLGSGAPRYAEEGNEELSRDTLSLQDRRRLYTFGVSEWNDIPTLAQLWMEELGSKGLRGAHAEMQELALGDEDDPRTFSARLPKNVRFPVRWGEKSKQLLWVHPNGGLNQDGQTHVEVSPRPELTDQAILAALTVLEAGNEYVELDRSRLSKALDKMEFPLKSRIYDYMITLRRRATVLESEGSYQAFERFMAPYPEMEVDRALGTQYQALELIVALLRYYRPGFDDLPRGEQRDLILRTFDFMYKLSKDSLGLIAFLQHGTADKGLPKRGVERAQTYVNAVVWNQVEGLGHREIGQRLGIDPSPTDLRQGGHKKVAAMVKSGKGIVEAAFGKEGWRRLVGAMKARAEWFNSLDHDDKETEWIVDAQSESIREGTLSESWLRSNLEHGDDAED